MSTSCLISWTTSGSRDYDFFDRESEFLRDARLEALIAKLQNDQTLFVDEHGREVLDLAKLGTLAALGAAGAVSATAAVGDLREPRGLRRTVRRAAGRGPA